MILYICFDQKVDRFIFMREFSNILECFPYLLKEMEI